MRTKKVISAILKILVSFFAIVVLLAFALYFVLIGGIKFDHLSFGSIKINEFYLKLDKKAIVLIDTIEITDDGSEPTFQPKFNATTINLVQEVLDKFSSIEIKHIKYGSFVGYFKFSDKNIVVNSNKINLAVDYRNNGDLYDLNVLKLDIKEKNIQINGNIKADVSTKKLDFILQAKYKDLLANIKIHKPNNVANITVSSNTLGTIQFIKDFKNFDATFSDWLFERLRFENVAINNLSIDFNTEEEVFDFNSLKVFGIVNNATLRFKDDIDLIRAKQINVSISNTNMQLDFDQLYYKEKSLFGSLAIIENIFTNPVLKLKLNYQDKIDNDIAEVLKAYSIKNIPKLTQIAGVTNANVEIAIPFDEGQTKIIANANATNSKYLFEGHTIVANTLNFIYDENLFIKDSSLSYDDINTSIDELVYYLDAQQLQTKGSVILPVIGKVGLKAHTDFSNNSFNGTVFVDKFKYDKYIDIQKKDFDFFGIASESFSLFIPELDLKFSRLDDVNRFEMPSIKKLLQLSQMAKAYKIDDGNLSLTTKDFKDLDFIVTIKNPKFPFEIKSNGRYLSQFKISGEKRGSSLKLWDDKNLIKMTKNSNIGVTIKNVDVKYDLNLLDENDKNAILSKPKQTIYEKISRSLDLPKLKISVDNCSFNDGNKSYKIDELDIVAQNNDIHAKYKNGISRLEVNKSGNNLEVSGIKITDKFLDAMLGKNIFENGYINFKTTGNLEKQSGFINMVDIDMIGTPIVSNIKKGEALFNLDTKKEILDITKIKTIGSLADLSGTGSIDLRSLNINGNLDIVFVNTITDLVRLIPLYGYILVGDDSKIYTSTTISGKLNNPVVEIHLVKDTSLGLINILKRVILLPAKAVEVLQKAISETNTTKKK